MKSGSRKEDAAVIARAAGVARRFESWRRSSRTISMELGSKPSRERPLKIAIRRIATTLIGLFASSGPEDVDAAVRAAKKAFAHWRLVPAPKRGEILYRVGDLLRKHKEEIARGMTREMGKDPERDSWRRAGGNRYRLLRRRRRTTAFRCHDSFRTSRQICYVCALACGCLRFDYAMELSHGDPHLEIVSRVCSAATQWCSNPLKIRRTLP